ncbi:hypothetical protein ACWC4J_39390, partial [Streptomyces sp. NPDC001356]
MTGDNPGARTRDLRARTGRGTPAARRAPLLDLPHPGGKRRTAATPVRSHPRGSRRGTAVPHSAP